MQCCVPLSHCYGVPGTAQTRAKQTDGFTLAELVVSVGVLVLLVLLFSQLLNSAATVTTFGHKQMDADSQARQVLDRMAVDVAQMVKRSDVDYYLKSSAAAPFRQGAATRETIESHFIALCRVTTHPVRRARSKAPSRWSPTG